MRVSNIISISAISTSGVFAQGNNATGVGSQPRYPCYNNTNLHHQQLGDAAATTGNPAGKSVIAVLPEQAFYTGSLNGNVKGSVAATSGPDGVGVNYQVSFSNLPSEGGPFSMSILLIYGHIGHLC